VKIYVGNLSYGTTEDTLREAFSRFGAVDSVDIVYDRYTGRSRGFGFVEMGDDAQARSAISALHGKDLDGRSLNVNEAKPRTEQPRRSLRY